MFSSLSNSKWSKFWTVGVLCQILWGDFTSKRPSQQHPHVTRQSGDASMNGYAGSIINLTFFNLSLFCS